MGHEDGESAYRHTGGWALTVWKIMDDPSSGPIVRRACPLPPRTEPAAPMRVHARLVNHLICLSSPQAKKWSLFMMFVILFSILNFTLASVPGSLIQVDIWANTTTREVIPFSVEGDYKGNGDGTYRWDGDVRQTSDKHDDYRQPYRALEVFCILTFTFDFFVRLATCSAGPGLKRFIRGPSNIIDLVRPPPLQLPPSLRCPHASATVGIHAQMGVWLLSLLAAPTIAHALLPTPPPSAALRCSPLVNKEEHAV